MPIRSASPSPGHQWRGGPSRPQLAIASGRRRLLAPVALVLLAQSLAGLEQLAERYRRFLEEEAVYIITDKERERFVALRSNGERDRFIETFWKVRDPIPETLENEFKQEHFRRIAEANRKFREARKGSQTDRGRMYILLGPPDDVMRYPSLQELYPLEIWYYDRLDIPRLPPSLQFIFFRRNGVGEYRLFSPAFDGFKELMADRVARGLLGPTGQVPFDFRRYFDVEIIKAAEGVAPGYGPQASEEIIAQVQTPGVLFEDLDRKLEGRVRTEVTFGRDLPLELATHYFKGEGDFSQVHLSVEIAPEELRVNRYGEKLQGRIDLFGTVRALKGDIVEEFRDTAELTIDASDWTRAQHFPFLYQRKLSLLPGRYRMELVARDFVARRLGRAERVISVPAFPTEKLSVSSLVAAFKADEVTPRAQADALPLTFGRLRLYPKPDREFGVRQRVVAFLEVYYPRRAFAGSREARPMISARFILHRGEETVIDETNRYYPRAGSEGTVDVLKVLSGETLQPGAYRLETLLSEPSTGFNEMARLDFTVGEPQEMGRLSTIGLAQRSPAGAFLLQGHKYFLAGDYGNAIHRYQAALDYQGLLQPARIGKARAQIFAGDPVSGEKTAREAVERAPDDPEAMATLGLAVSRQGRYGEAAHSYRKALELGGESVEILNALGEAEYHAGHPEAARKALSRSLELDPEQQEVRRFLDQVSKPRVQEKRP